MEKQCSNQNHHILTSVCGWFNLRLLQACSFKSTAHLYSIEKTQYASLDLDHIHNEVHFIRALWWNNQILIYCTVTRFRPPKFAPRHKPVDIAPQPEYISSNLTSSLLCFSLISLEFTSQLDPAISPSSVETVEDVSLPSFWSSAV